METGIAKSARKRPATRSGGFGAGDYRRGGAARSWGVLEGSVRVRRGGAADGTPIQAVQHGIFRAGTARMRARPVGVRAGRGLGATFSRLEGVGGRWVGALRFGVVAIVAVTASGGFR